jgi:transcriptional regulator with XRE-family HTH domain
MDQNIDVLLGRRLRNRRRLMGLTQGQLAELVGVRFQQIQKYEAGANRISAARLWRLAQALNVPAAYFFDGLPSLNGVGNGAGLECASDDGGRLMEEPESVDLMRAFRQLGEQPRRRLLDLAKSLNTRIEPI